MPTLQMQWRTAGRQRLPPMTGRPAWLRGRLRPHSIRDKRGETRMDPRGHTAIVTGGGSGLGEATARALAARGARVAVLDIGMERAGDVAAAIGGVAIRCDVSSAEDGEAAVAEAASRLG